MNNTGREEVAIAPDMVDHVHFTVSAEQWEAFCEALDAPPRDIPALKKLLREGCVFDDTEHRAP